MPLNHRTPISITSLNVLLRLRLISRFVSTNRHTGILIIKCCRFGISIKSLLKVIFDKSSWDKVGVDTSCPSGQDVFSITLREYLGSKVIVSTSAQKATRARGVVRSPTYFLSCFITTVIIISRADDLMIVFRILMYRA